MFYVAIIILALIVSGAWSIFDRAKRKSSTEEALVAAFNCHPVILSFVAETHLGLSGNKAEFLIWWFRDNPIEREEIIEICRLRGGLVGSLSSARGQMLLNRAVEELKRRGIE